VDYGAALEMRFGATRRGFESRPLRHIRPPSGRPSRRWLPPGLTHAPQGALVRSSPAALGWTPARQAEVPCQTATSAPNVRSAVDFRRRARRGTSGALYLQSAPAGLNSLPRPPSSSADASSDVEGRVPRSGDSRTVSGPEGSSTKRSSSGAAERPGPSRSLRWARERSGQRRVHGIRLRQSRGVR
jgi:hypothetical protein